MDREELKSRSNQFAVDVIWLVRTFPRDVPTSVIAKQLLRSATSVGANYRAACRGRSRADFIAKLGIVLEEADESLYWLELLQSDGTVTQETLPALITEGREICAIIFSAVRTARENLKPKTPPRSVPPRLRPV